MSAHSPIAPSSAARRWKCRASSMREAMFPEIEDSEHSREGTAVHWAGAEQAAGRLVDVGVMAPNGVALTQEMTEAADAWSDWLERFLKPYGLTPQQGYIERAIAIPAIHEQSWGTPDYFAWLPANGGRLHLFIADLKYGKGVVEVVENPQLIEYVAGICHSIPNDLEPGVDITFGICQPRAFHRDGPIRTWTTSLASLRAHFNIARAAAEEALGPNPPATPGPAQCRDCKARHACVELMTSTGYRSDVAGRSTPRVLTPAELAVMLDFAEDTVAMAKALLSGLEEQAEALIKAGQRVPGRALEHGDGRLVWSRPASEVIAVAASMGLDIAKKVEAITPLQAADKGLHPDILKALAHRPPGASKLTRVKDEHVKKVFSARPSA